MSNTDEIRWQQRLANFSQAMSRLDAACEQDDYSDLERAGLVKTFEFSFELAWKSIQVVARFEAQDCASARTAIATA